jgi:sporulenol synthase
VTAAFCGCEVLLRDNRRQGRLGLLNTLVENCRAFQASEVWTKMDWNNNVGSGGEAFESLGRVLEDGLERLVASQAQDGSWQHAFDTGVMPDAQTAIGLYLLGEQAWDWVRPLLVRLQAMQEEHGGWSVYPGDGGDLSTTVECYYALTLWRAWPVGSELAKCRAEKFIRERGGLRKCRNLTKTWLAVGGEILWRELPSARWYSMLLRRWSPIRLEQLTIFTQLHIVPMLLLGHLRYVSPYAKAPVLADLDMHSRISRRGSSWTGDKDARTTNARRLLVRRRASERCRQMILKHQEDDGTLAGYHSSTFLWLLAKRAWVHPDTCDVSQELCSIRKNCLFIAGEFGKHQQTCNAHVWNTSLALQALQEKSLWAHEKTHARAIDRGVAYLLTHQHRMEYGGGWAFSSNNTRHPDTDDTVAALTALIPVRTSHAAAWSRGVQFLLDRQNKDGGWSAFVKNAGKSYLEWIPANDMKRAMADPSTADVTGRVLEFLVRSQSLPSAHPVVVRGCRWLLRHQEADGSWYGRWGTAYVYGTWCAVRALVSHTHQAGVRASLRIALDWLMSVQREDGGFGESAASECLGHYVPLGHSLPTQTAWALDTLVALATGDLDEALRRAAYRSAERCALWLLKHEHHGQWEEDYPTGSAFAGALHIRYHIYREVWPLLALSRFAEMMESGHAGSVKGGEQHGASALICSLSLKDCQSHVLAQNPSDSSLLLAGRLGHARGSCSTCRPHELCIERADHACGAGRSRAVACGAAD